MKRLIIPFTMPYWVCRTGSYVLSFISITIVSGLTIAAILGLALGLGYIFDHSNLTEFLGIPWPLWLIGGPAVGIVSFIVFSITKENAEGYYRKCINYWHGDSNNE